ncbi:Haemolytic domain-containing protein [Cephalotus follicularis]|uniref:Haemolytic domain-containing protein n=1 Tax=Cephalotus follicularis TaxID=3775 RepID=A0A1Q3C8G7_CEPFO|nr:Haemolytic domain-containing protein [Cephalotus follicularis]
MAVVVVSLPLLNCHKPFFSAQSQNPNFISLNNRKHTTKAFKQNNLTVINGLNKISDENNLQDNEVNSIGVKVALSMLRFYKMEISPAIPKSCRYVPTCSEYSMEAYKKYGVVKGTILTAFRLCRCNPLGGSGFDPPRWFNEESPTIEE